MLQNKDREKIENEINDSIEKIKKSAKKAIRDGMSDEQLIEKVVNITVKKFTPKSKMLLSSICNILLEETLSDERYKDLKNKAFLYEKDIISEISNCFIFEVPDNVTYTKSKVEAEKMLASGGIVISGGLISIAVNKMFPVVISAIVAAVMYFALMKCDKQRKHIYEAICEYLDLVGVTLLQWLDNVQEYYCERIQEIEKEMDVNG